LPELPEGWVWTTLDEVSCHITSGSRGWAKYYSESGSLFIRAQDISTDELVLDTVASVELPESVEGVRTQVFKDDLLVTITGANVTKAALARQEFDEAYVSQHVGLVRPVLTGTSPYLYYWIVSPTHGRRILEKDAYGAGKPGLSLANLRELVVALPCLAEQDRIVAEVEQRLSVVVALEREVEVALVRAQRLRQSILKHAFEGKLVPQNPADKPASELLEHIKVLSRKLKKEQKRRRDRQRKQRAEEEHRISVGTPSELRELVRQLQRQTGGPIPVEQLLKMSKLEIEEFHILLREGIRSGHIREQRDGYWAFLETADENQEPMD
jgi:type I restriction enzyme S subunit